MKIILQTIFIIGALVFHLKSSAQTNQVIKLEITPRHLNCYASNDGAAVLTVTGGVPPYTYLWSDSSKTKDLNSASAGLHSVKVTDAAGNFSTACIEMFQPDPLVVSVDAPELLCSGGSANVTVSVSGGTSPYKITWQDGYTGTTRSGVKPGKYIVLVTDSKLCTKESAFEIKEGGGFGITIVKSDVKCFGNHEGSAIASITGTSNYSYLWSNGSVSNKIENLAAGNYNLKVTDVTGCSKDTAFIILQPAEISLATKESYHSCDGAEVLSTISGGVEPYKYFWSTGARTKDLAGLANGVYFLRVTDNNGCLKSSTVNISGVNLLNVSSSVKMVTCSESSNGEISLTATGGTEPYSYNWSHGPTTAHIDGLSAGSYSVLVTDANGCSSTLNEDVDKDDPFKFEIDQKNISCYGNQDGSISITPTGTQDFSYEWSDGSTTSTITNLNSGDYSVVVTSPEGCTRILQFTIPTPQKIELLINTTFEECSGGGIDLVVSGGTSPFQYKWSNGEESEDLEKLVSDYYSVVVTDVNGCKDSTETYIHGSVVPQLKVNSHPASCSEYSDGSAAITIIGETGPYNIEWSNGSNLSTIDHLSKGVYTVKVTDSKNCEYYSSATISEPEKLQSYLFKTDPSCFDSKDGILRSLVRGGTSPYTFNWVHGGNSSNVSGLEAGSYTLEVTDENGCKTSASSELINPEAVVVTFIAQNNCRGSLVTLTPAGGKSPYSIRWEDGSDLLERRGLGAGNYSITVSDVNKCSVSKIVTIQNYVNLEVTTKTEGNSATVLAYGGAQPYTYLWSTGHVTAQANNLPNGVHTVKVTDSQGCTTSSSVTIRATTTAPLSATIDCCQDQVICKGETANIPVYFTGQAPYTLTYKSGNNVKTITTSQNPYFINTVLTGTTSFSLLSISNGCSNGTVCGNATIGVNDCGTRCEMICFSAEVTQVTENGDCREVKMKISNTGNCKYGLSHLSVSAPCGKVGAVTNSRNYKLEKGTDPTTGIKGFKLDNTNNFGEAKNGKPEAFELSYTLCKSSTDCFGEFCAPMVAFKASTCVYYVKASYVPQMGTIANMEESSLERTNEVKIYPNPGTENTELNIQMTGLAGSGKITIVDFKGQTVLTKEVNFNPADNIASLPLTGMKQGIYLVRIEKDGKQYLKKLDIE